MKLNYYALWTWAASWDTTIQTIALLIEDK